MSLRFDRLADIARALRPNYPQRYFHVTIALNKKRVVAIGVNKQDYTHPMTLRLGYRHPNDPGIVGVHSELSCVLKLGCEDCSDLTFVNMRITPSNQLGMSCPCNGCQNLLKQVGFRRVFYSTGTGENFSEWDTSTPPIPTSRRTPPIPKWYRPTIILSGSQTH